MKFIGVYDYTVILTYISLISSIFGMTQAIHGDYKMAIFCLAFSGVCDAFDGRIARSKKNRTEDEKSFGIQLDSLNDLICFGVLPAAIGASYGVRDVWYLAILIFFALAALIRLAYFNVTAEMQEDKGAVRKYYLGVPVTTGALVVPLFWLIPRALALTECYWYVGGLLVLGILFITPVKVKKAGLSGILAMTAMGLLELYLMFTVGMA